MTRLPRAAAISLTAGIAFLFAPGCRDVMPRTVGANAPRDSAACGMRVSSNDGRYCVCFTTTPDPVPLNEPFSMSIRIYEGSTPEHLAKTVVLDVDAGMPEHHHGMTLRPEIRAVGAPAVQEVPPGHGAIGNGQFEVRSMLFHMPGRWEIHFDVTHGAITERAQVEIDLD